jgi:hypothetical protein
LKVLLQISDSFWDNVTKGAPEECWPWNKHLRKGYGSVKIGGKGGVSQRAIGEKYGVQQGTVSRIVAGKRYSK